MKKTRSSKAGKSRRTLGRGLYLRGEIYWVSFYRAGKRHYFSLETRDVHVAAQRAERLRTGPEMAPKSAMQEDIAHFFAAKKALNRCTRQTERVHGAALREFSESLPGLCVRDIRPSHVAAHYARLQARVAETSAQIHMRGIRSFFSWCVETKRCGENPVKAVKLARIDRPAKLRFCTKADRDRIIATAPNDDLRFILFCGFHCGMRKNEIIEARVRWFDLDGGAVYLQNTESFRLKDRDARHIPLTQAFLEFLRGYLRRKELDATDACDAMDKRGDRFALKPGVRHGRAIYRYDFHKPFTLHLRAARMEWVTAHVMRHTFASLLVQSNVSIYKVARWLGDGVEVVEKHYAHLAPQDADIEKMV
jgi:integrase